MIMMIYIKLFMHILSESKPKELFSDIPMIHFLPMPNRTTPTTGIYNCPIYKVKIILFLLII